jgi:hypothetical protein
MTKRSFTWDPQGTCLFGGLRNPTSRCLLDYWSFYHFYFTGFFYILFHHLFDLKSLKSALLLVLVLTLLHGVEEYLGNTSRISLEGVVIDNLGPLLDPKMNPANREPDDDYLQNSIGDVLVGLVSSGLIVAYWYRWGQLPYWYLWGFAIAFWMLWRLTPMFHDTQLSVYVGRMVATTHNSTNNDDRPG